MISIAFDEPRSIMSPVLRIVLPLCAIVFNLLIATCSIAVGAEVRGDSDGEVDVKEDFGIPEAARVFVTTDRWTHTFILLTPTNEVLIWDTDKAAVSSRFHLPLKVLESVRSERVPRDKIVFISTANRRKLVVGVRQDWWLLDTRAGAVEKKLDPKPVWCGVMDEHYADSDRTFYVYTESEGTSHEKGFVAVYDLESGQVAKRWNAPDTASLWTERMQLPVEPKDIRLYHPRGIGAFAIDGTTEDLLTAVVLWDLSAGKELWRIGGKLREAGARAGRFSPDGSTVTIFRSGKIEETMPLAVHDVRSGRVLATLKLPPRAPALNRAWFNARGDRVLLETSGQRDLLWGWKNDGKVVWYEEPWDGKEGWPPRKWSMLSSDESRVHMLTHNLIVYQFDSRTGRLLAETPVPIGQSPKSMKLKGLPSLASQ